MYSYSHNILGTLVAFCIFVMGCSTSGPPLATVQGKIMCKGQGVPNASIRFEPETPEMGSVGAEGTTDANGAFTLTTPGRGRGAIPGKHRVLINYEDAYKHPPCSLPKSYTLEVTSGANDFMIELDKLGNSK